MKKFDNVIKFLESLLDWIYKKKCYFCSKSAQSVRMCSDCYDSLEFLPVKINRIYNGINIYCAGIYSKNLQKMIRGLKYHGQKELAYYQAKFMFEYWKKLDIEGDFQIVPVPIYPKRKRQRKYNHMDLVAEEFSKLSGFEVNPAIIQRIKDTKPQYKLNKIQRLDNLSGAFKVNSDKYIKGKKLLLLDDICTTGSTFEQMINEFKKYNINDIVCFATTTPFE